MGALAVTASQVKAGDDAVVTNGRVGVSVTPGQTVFYENSSSSWKLASATSTLEASSTQGVTLAQASTNGSIGIQTDGLLIVGAGAAPVKGTIYIQGATAGSIHPSADAVTGWAITPLGVGDGAGGIILSINPSLQIVP